MANTAGAGAPIRQPAMQLAVLESEAGTAARSGQEGGSARLGNIVEKILANVQRIDNKVLFALLVSLARGVDYALTHNEIPSVANLLPTLVKEEMSNSRYNMDAGGGAGSSSVMSASDPRYNQLSMMGGTRALGLLPSSSNNPFGLQ